MNSKALMLLRIMIVSVSVAAVVALATPARAGLRSPSGRAMHRAALATTTIRVITHNSTFLLSARTAPRGVVVFKVTNTASFGHDFSINGHTTRVLKTGQSATLRVTFLRPGHYVWKDTVDHHAHGGDEGGFTIT